MNGPQTILTEQNFQREVLESLMPVLVEFKSDWSGSSHIMAPVIDRISLHYRHRCKVCVMDYDASDTIVGKYGVTMPPTILLFKDGTLMGRLTGAVSESALQTWIEAALDQDGGFRTSG